MKFQEKDVDCSYADVENQSSLSVSSRSSSSTLRGPADGCDKVTSNGDDEDSILVDETQSINNMESRLRVTEERNQQDNSNISVVNYDPCLKNELSSGSLHDIERQRNSNVERRRELDKDVLDQQGEKSKVDAIIGKVATFK